MNKYNDIKYIRKSLATVASFDKMLSQRTEAGYKRKEHLEQFLIKGKWFLDSCGNCCRLDKPIIGMDDVEPYENLKSCGPYSMRLSRSFPANLQVRCAFCGGKFFIDDFYNARKEEVPSEVIILNDFIGKTFADVKRHYRKFEKADFICNSAEISEEGWVPLNNDYVIRPGNKMLLMPYMYYHHDCYEHKIIKETAQIINHNKSYDHFRNLAGEEFADHWIRAELFLAGIGIHSCAKMGEVPATLCGQFGKFKFRRAWTYWVVDGPVPLNIAKELYSDPVGKKYVRVMGHCGCPDPIEWANGKNYIDYYHIDTLPGLILFVSKIEVS